VSGTETGAPLIFRESDLVPRAQSLGDEYARGVPFPHIVIDDFLSEEQAERLLAVFPGMHDDVWLDWRKRDIVHQPRKQGIGHASRLDMASPQLQSMLLAFNSYPFLRFLEVLTGIDKLLPDPHFHGGGCHQILSGGKLAIHTDFNRLSRLDMYRRLNALLYLNKDWRPEYRGDLELWSEDCSRCVKSVAPIFNRLVVFTTNKRSFHGHPAPLATPEGVTRKSIALYYYTAKPAPEEHYDEVTDWRDTHAAAQR